MSFFSLGFDSEICEEQQWLDKAADIMAARRLLAKEEAHERKRIRKRSKRSEAKRSEAKPRSFKSSHGSSGGGGPTLV